MSKYNILKRVPGYIWTILALILGLTLGGVYSESFSGVAKGTQTTLGWFITFVPLLIFVALSPAVSKLTSMGKGGKLAGSVILWYLFTSTIAGLIGLIISSLLFDIEFKSGDSNMIDSALEMFSTLNGDAGASLPLLAILVSVIMGLIAVKIPILQRLLNVFERGMNNSAPVLSVIMPFIVFFLGISLGVNTGATDSIKYYAMMTAYTFGLCLVWWLLYVFVVLKYFAKQSARKVINEYYLPTAVFAAGTCSSMATLPVNLANAKKYGVDEPVANFIIPVGSVLNMDTSAMAYVAYAPFIMSVVFDLPITGAALIVAWPAVVLFTIAAPGLPAGMGTALWSSTLFATLLGLTGPEKTTFITTWIALSGGIPDMLRTATNCTGDGFTAILFNKYFGSKKTENDKMANKQIE